MLTLRVHLKQLIVISLLKDLYVTNKLVGMGSDGGTNEMLGKRNSVLTRLKAVQPSFVSFHCNCHSAALIANHACSILPDYLDDLIVVHLEEINGNSVNSK